MAVFAPPRADAKSVVVFHSWDWRAPENFVADRILREELATTDGADLYSEFLDEARFPGPVHERQLANFLRERYAGVRVNVLIARDPTALRFLMNHRDEIFPGTPVAFAGLRDSTLARLKPPADFVGAPLRMNARPTVELALKLWPNAREFVVVTGTSELDRIWEEHLKAACAAAAPAIPVRTLSGMPTKGIVQAVAALPPATIVLAGPFRRDAEGNTFADVYGFLQSLKAVSGAPIFHTFETAVGLGALASYSVPFETTPRDAAAIAKQLLSGVAPAVVTLPAPAKAVPFIDWRELRRWGIPESSIPPDAVVRFREPTFWDQYRYHALGILSAVLLQSALITLLLVQRQRQTRTQSTLRRNEETMKLATDAAELAMWSWDVERDIVTRVSAPGHFRTTPPSGSGFQSFLSAVHADDREAVTRALRRALDGDGPYESEYRVPDPEGKIRWYATRGNVEIVHGKPRQVHGITLDITSRKAAELDAQHRRQELAHMSRVTMVGEMSGSIAHELNQPLTAILANAQAAQMFIRHEPVDMVELASILDDIVENDKRAGAIILSLRKMLKKEAAELEVLAINELVQEVLRLMRNDLVNREVAVETRLAPENPHVRGDHTQLQQVLMNLLLNACDAMAHLPRSERILGVGIEVVGKEVRVKVADRGGGIAEGLQEEIFTPFFTTKPQGLGLGLAVCRTIITSHGGTLRADNNRDQGATFTFVLGAETEALA